MACSNKIHTELISSEFCPILKYLHKLIVTGLINQHTVQLIQSKWIGGQFYFNTKKPAYTKHNNRAAEMTLTEIRPITYFHFQPERKRFGTEDMFKLLWVPLFSRTQKEKLVSFFFPFLQNTGEISLSLSRFLSFSLSLARSLSLSLSLSPSLSLSLSLLPLSLSVFFTQRPSMVQSTLSCSKGQAQRRGTH